MLQLDNFCAWISVDERELLEYAVEHSEDQLSVTCWIASEEGKAFVINWKDTVRVENSMGRINRKGYRKDATKERDYAQQRGAATGMGTDRLLVFSKLDVTDDDMYLDAGPSDKLGEIKLEISLGKLVMGERKPVHRVKSFGHPRVFVFRYRPLEVLQAMGIAPRDHQAQRDVIDHLQEHPGIVDLTMDSGDEEAHIHENLVTTASGDVRLSTQSDEQVPVIEEPVSDHKSELKIPKEELKDVKIKLEDRKIKQEELETKFKTSVKRKADVVKVEQGHPIKQKPKTVKQESKAIVKLESISPLKLKKEEQDVKPLRFKEGAGSVKSEFGSVVKIEKLKKAEKDEIQILNRVPVVIDLTED
ncbi:hypothetical protein NLJ89_g9124 [Agrocybe chaxingu]|uniref:Uncharacterized protein n=1 Tax=Agrocybe chaxingu TaxID=84603 RepID=A0A9W8JTW8_9AGAR|nr:hypothetical protein NLJ89_g9124 [Agrocybe chaxingu]